MIMVTIPKNKPKKPIDITKQGALTWQQLKEENARIGDEDPSIAHRFGLRTAGEFHLPVYNYAYTGLEQSPLMQQKTRLGDQDYFGRSVWDEGEVTIDQLSQLGDIRAQNQPWYSKITNGIAKGVVLTGTTALEGILGLTYGLGKATLYDHKLSSLWDNEVTRALQTVNDWSEEAMPNYYTKDEMENPLHNIFSANFLGDKLIKNFGFMVGAFYGGIPVSWSIGKLGQMAVRSAEAGFDATRMATMARVMNGTMTGAERMKMLHTGMDRVRQVANATRNTTQIVGALSSAINEGAIEALNNSRDWEQNAMMLAKEKYENELDKIDALYYGTADEDRLKAEAMEKYERELEEIQKGKAKMGNADLVMNIPILMASNLLNLGKLYTRGFESNRRRLGSFWNKHSLPGTLRKANITTDMTKKKAFLRALRVGNVEGMEEYFQRSASESAGNTVQAFIDRHLGDKEDEDAHENLVDYVVNCSKNFLKASGTNLADQSAIEEYLVGALSGLIGMPVGGSQVKNAWAKLGPVGIAGGAVGAYNDYVAKMNHERGIAETFNKRMKDPKFKELYENLHAHIKKDGDLYDALLLGDKEKFKTLEFEQIFDDINAAASSGHLEEFLEIIGYNDDLSDAELASIVENTSFETTAEDQREADESKLQAYNTFIEKYEDMPDEEKTELGNEAYEAIKEEVAAIDKRLKENKYQNKKEGEFITTDDNGVSIGMNISDPKKMRQILEDKRKELKNLVESILKIRDDIDIETDGRLDDKDIVTLVKLRAGVDDMMLRSDSMTDKSLGYLKTVLEDYNTGNTLADASVTKYQDDEKTARTKYEEAKKELKKAEESNASQATLLDKRTEVQKTKREYIDARNKLAVLTVGTKLLEIMVEDKDETLSEDAGRKLGEYDKDTWANRIKALTKAAAERIKGGQKRKPNTREVQAFLKSEKNKKLLTTMIASSKSLSSKEQEDLIMYLSDLHSLAKSMDDYHTELRKMMKDRTLINEAKQQRQDRISKEEKDNKIEELALQIKGATSLYELDEIVNEAYQIDQSVAEAALEKARQSGSDELKALIDDYNKLKSYVDSFDAQAFAYPESIRAGIRSASSESRNRVVLGSTGNSVELYKSELKAFAETGMKPDLEDDMSTVDTKRKTGKAILDILDALDEAEQSIATNAETRPNPEGGNKEDNGSGIVRKSGGVSAEGLLRRVSQDTRPVLEAAIKDHVRTILNSDTSAPVLSIDELPDSLKGRVKAFNEKHKDDKDAIITDSDVSKIYQDLFNAYEAGIDLDGGEEDSEAALGGDGKNYFSEISKAWQDILSGHFTNDEVSRFLYGLTYRMPYIEKGPLAALFERIQTFLIEKGAYNFIDHNYLGYIYKDNSNIPVHLIRSTDASLSEGRATTFLAIEIGDDEEESIREHAFNGDSTARLDGIFNLIDINGSKYQIIGVLSYAKDASPELQAAFKDLQDVIGTKYEEQLQKAKDEGKGIPQFIDSGYSVFIDTIFTGRLDKGNSDADTGTNQSLSDFVSARNESAQSEPGSRDNVPARKASDEWENGMPFYFATIVNGNMSTDIPEEDIWQEVNSEWANKHNGAVFLFVRKPDGKLYPLQVRKRTVADFLKTKGKDGFDSALLSDMRKNAYFKYMLDLLSEVFNQRVSDKKRVDSRRVLAKFLLFAKKDSNGSSSLYVDGEYVTARFKTAADVFEEKTFNCNDKIEDNIIKFLDFCKTCGIKFSLPSPHLHKIDGRDVILSDVFEINVRGFHNFNASVSFKPIDTDGNIIDLGTTSGKNPVARTNPVLRTYDVGYGDVEYIIEPNGAVVRRDGKTIEEEERRKVLMIHKAVEAGKVGIEALVPLIGTLVNKDDDAGSEYDGVVVINDDVNDETWVYDPRIKNTSNRLYLYSDVNGLTKEGNALYEELVKLGRSTGKGFTIVLKGTGRVSGTSQDDDDDKKGQSGGGSAPATAGNTGGASGAQAAQGSGNGNGGSKGTYDVKMEDINADNNSNPLLSLVAKNGAGKPDIARSVLALLHSAELAGKVVDADDKELQKLIKDYFNASTKSKRSKAYDTLSDKLFCRT